MWGFSTLGPKAMPADDGGPLPADALSQPRAGEDDIAGDHEPKGVIADERDIDKDADDPKNHQHERDDKSKAHLQPQGYEVRLTRVLG